MKSWIKPVLLPRWGAGVGIGESVEVCRLDAANKTKKLYYRRDKKEREYIFHLGSGGMWKRIKPELLPSSLVGEGGGESVQVFCILIEGCKQRGTNLYFKRGIRDKDYVQRNVKERHTEKELRKLLEINTWRYSEHNVEVMQESRHQAIDSYLNGFFVIGTHRPCTN